ncbi:PUA-like domain-containing protein [Fomitopsis betulina]|nr:PUA-like domain-containing protein [Fomitopsis betulina]
MPVAAKRTLAQHDTFGHIIGVPVGAFWASRRECSEARVHAPVTAGISGTKERGAYSIVVSGVLGYEDDVDEGDRIIYTGSGGRAKGDQSRTGPQTKDQSFADPRNAALLESCETGNPVRVVRGAELRSEYAPPGGDCKYRYDGLYTVTNAWLERGRAGYNICRFELQRLPNQPPIPIGGTTFAAQTSNKRRVRNSSPIPEPKFEGAPIPYMSNTSSSSTANTASTSGQAASARTPVGVASSLPARMNASTSARPHPL